MAERPKSEPQRSEASARLDEEKLAHALVSRGLVTAEEMQTCKSSEKGGSASAGGLLSRLVSAGLLTRGQAKRAQQELSQLLGQQVPGYQLLEKLGQGSMGVVYKARQISLNRVVAVKVLHPRLAARPELLERLEHEAHLAARLSHNNIVQAIDVGSAGSLHYFVMELVEGKTIRQELDAGKVFAEREAVDIILQVAQALAHAHKRGLIHRDVKPANIVLTTEGIAKLADLGLARTTKGDRMAQSERGLLIGTPYYVAPEQVEEEDVDGRADLYSLGATLYHMVTGQPPYPHKGVEAVLDAHLNEELTPPDHINPNLSAGLGEVVELLLAKERKGRYRNAEDLVIDLECLLVGEAPKLARQRIEAGTLHGLTEGEAEEEEGASPAGVPNWAKVTMGVLGAVLAVSALLNVILLLRRH